MKLEHKAYWAIKQTNFDLTVAGDHRKIQLNELNELRDQAYENSLIYKEKTKRIHDSKIKNSVFNVGDRVLLLNSRLKIFSGKHKTRWSGPFTIAKVFPYGTVELSQADGPNFKVNGHRINHYFGGDVPQLVVPDLQTFPLDQTKYGEISIPGNMKTLAKGFVLKSSFPLHNLGITILHHLHLIFFLGFPMIMYVMEMITLTCAGSESRPLMLNKENYVPWSSRLLRYAKSRPNRKLIHNSILNGPYVRRMIAEPSDGERDVNLNETFHEQTNDELSERELKQIEADDQSIQTILLGLPEDIYAAVDSC
nr:reverse transcriptase domain-containing protein [Tanacetum cinerariifolium]